MTGPAGTSPGPWRMERDYDNACSIYSADGTNLGEVNQEGSDCKEMPVEEMLANAHLLAAAQDLYAALFCPDSMHGGPHRGDGERCGLCHRKIYDIEADQFESLAKARGEVPA